LAFDIETSSVSFFQRELLQHELRLPAWFQVWDFSRFNDDSMMIPRLGLAGIGFSTQLKILLLTRGKISSR